MSSKNIPVAPVFLHYNALQGIEPRIVTLWLRLHIKVKLFTSIKTYVGNNTTLIRRIGLLLNEILGLQWFVTSEMTDKLQILK